ncbi:MAG: sugar ABC transporter ATP-binding protein [Rhodospirillales bacterium]|nr:sugar ABC transporter ATP-binding protein [Rhodospirillales bacterium]
MAVELRGISKRYGQVLALENVDFTLERGEIVGLVGDNGAGKSTLMKVLSGAVRPDSGSFAVDGQPVNPGNPIGAREAGVEMLYQDLSLVDDLPTVMNVFLGRELTTRFGFLRFGEMRRHAQGIVDGFSVRGFSVTQPVGQLSGGQRQVSAIARSIGFGSRYVILDEPTSALSPNARQEVVEIISGLARSGIGVVMVSHDLATVRQICSRVAVLHLGRLAGVRAMTDTTQQELVSLIVDGHA